jgi:hypothetical protein
MIIHASGNARQSVGRGVSLRAGAAGSILGLSFSFFESSDVMEFKTKIQNKKLRDAGYRFASLSAMKRTF